jgi:hypothetical protein
LKNKQQQQWKQEQQQNKKFESKAGDFRSWA